MTPDPLFARDLTSTALAEASGLSHEDLAEYEAAGLISPVRRTRAGNPRWHPSVLLALALLRLHQATDAHADPDAAAAVDALPRHQTPTLLDWRFLLWQLELDAEQRLDRVSRLRDRLRRCAGCGCAMVDDCALVQDLAPDFGAVLRQRRRGPGDQRRATSS